MLSIPLVHHFGNKYEGYHGDVDKTELASVLMFILLVLIIDIIVIIYAIYCIVDCTNKGLIPVWLAIVMGILIFTPGFGMMVSLGSIIFHFVSCGKKKI
jgi:hypothetical protein